MAKRNPKDSSLWSVFGLFGADSHRRAVAKLDKQVKSQQAFERLGGHVDKRGNRVVEHRKRVSRAEKKKAAEDFWDAVHRNPIHAGRMAARRRTRGKR